MRPPGDSLDPDALEALVRRLVREELARLFGRTSRAILEDWGHEGPEDPAQDDLLLRDALERLERHAGDPTAAIPFDELRRELILLEATGELPR